MITIPVRNLWLLQLFASDFQPRGRYVDSGSEHVPDDIPVFVSMILADEVSSRLNTGLTTGFNRTSRTVNRVRGKIDLLATARFQLLDRGKIYCHFDQIDHDILGNRLILAALRRASRFPSTDPRCARLADELARAGVSDQEPTRQERKELKNQRQLSRDRQMITAAELMLDLSIPEPGAGAAPVVAPKDEDGYLRTLFEKAVGGFYARFFRPRGWAVQTGKWLRWNEVEFTPGMSAILPKMQTDIILRPPSRPPIIVDTKFTRVTRANQYTQERLKSEYLYQMYAYVRSQEENPEFGPATTGLLLHPVVDGHIREWTFIGAHAFGVATVDLSGTYSEMVEQLRTVVETPNAIRR